LGMHPELQINTQAIDISKINKQEYGLARKGLGNAINVRLIN